MEDPFEHYFDEELCPSCRYAKWDNRGNRARGETLPSDQYWRGRCPACGMVVNLKAHTFSVTGENAQEVQSVGQAIQRKSPGTREEHSFRDFWTFLSDAL